MPTEEAYARSLLKKLRLARATLLELAAAGLVDEQQNERKKRARDAEALALERLKAAGIPLDSDAVTRATTTDAMRVVEREREKRAERAAAAAAAAREAETSERAGKRTKRGRVTGARCDGVWAMHALAKGGGEGDVGGTCEAAAREAAGADAKACGAGIWAATKLATRHDDADSDGRVVRSIARVMGALLRRMVEFEASEVDARGASGTLWSCATCQRTRAGSELDDVAMRRAVNDAASRLNASASTANAQDAANALWGAAKLRKTLEESCATRLVEALSQSEEAKTEEVSIALWALGTFAGDGWASAATVAPPLVRRAKEMAKKKPRDWSAQAVANTAWAVGKLATSYPNQDRADAKQLVSALFAIAKDMKNLSAQGFAHVLQGAGAVVVDNRLLADFSKFAYEGLRSRVSKITGADLAAVVEATEVLKLHTSMSHGEKLAKEIADAIERDVNSFDWQTVGRLDVALEGVFQDADATRLHATLRKRGIAACDAVDECRMDLERGSAEALLSQSIAAPVDEVSSSALVVDDGHRLVTKKLRRIGWKVVNWQRFSRGEHTIGTCWPEAPENGSFYAAAVVRLPPTKASLSMILHATAAHVQFGAPVWIYGAVTEGLRSVIADLPTGLFERAKLTMRDAEHGVIACYRSNLQPDKKGKELKKWRDKKTIDLSDVFPGAGELSWTSYPGLFAGGGLDVMTALLLRRVLPKLEKKAKLRVLDYCSGNGAIAAAVRVAAKKSKLTLLDADACALEAAKKNLEDNVDFVLSDGWTSLPSDRKFDLILSNPPVHLGLAVDFVPLRDFLAGAASRLKSDGVAYFVAQRYVPARALAGSLKLTLDFTDGRFAVWRCER